MTVLVTRGWPGAERTAAALRDIGINPIVSPVLDVNFRARIDADLSNVQAIAFTSANGVRAWGPRRPERDFPVFAVAKTTAEAARGIGFSDVQAAGGNVVSLAEMIARQLMAEDGEILHVRGIHAAGDLSGDLKKAGFKVRNAMGYGTVSVDTLGEEAIAAIISGAPISVLIHSARGGKTFLDLMKKFGLMRWSDSVSIYGLSENAVKPLKDVAFARVKFPATADEKSLLSLLGPDEELARARDAS
jgi:uroporphyrinogen-III synthase